MLFLESRRYWLTSCHISSQASRCSGWGVTKLSEELLCVLRLRNLGSKCGSDTWHFDIGQFSLLSKTNHSGMESVIEKTYKYVKSNHLKASFTLSLLKKELREFLLVFFQTYSGVCSAMLVKSTLVESRSRVI